MVTINSLPLRNTLPWLICFLYIVTVSIIITMLYRDLSNSINQFSLNQVKQISSQLQREMQNDLFQGKLLDAKRALLARSTDLQVQELFAVDENGRIFSSLNEAQVGYIPSSISERYNKVLASTVSNKPDSIVVQFRDERLIAAHYPLIRTSITNDVLKTSAGSIYLEYNLSPLYSALEGALIRRLVTLAVTILVISLVLYGFLVRYVTVPLDHLASFAEKITEGETVSLTVPQKAKGEVAKVSRALVTMSQQLHQRTDQMQQEVSKIKGKIDLDPLTGLPNRRLATQQLELSIKQAQQDNCRVAVLFIDLDNFKSVNDTFGHQQGDIFLQNVSSTLNKVTRMVDVVSRLGGDEFGIIVPGVHIDEEIHNLARRILDSLSQSFSDDVASVGVSASIGISMFPTHGTDGSTLLKAADDAMYIAKHRGKNNYVFYNTKSNA